MFGELYRCLEPVRLVFDALALQDGSLASEPEMKKKACFMSASPLIFWIVPSLLPQGDDGTLQTKEECGCLNLDLYSTAFMQYLQNVKGWCDLFLIYWLRRMKLWPVSQR